jgi:hypothetical protein
VASMAAGIVLRVGLLTAQPSGVVGIGTSSTMKVHYEVCDSLDHIKPCCPMFRAVKLPATSCGYAIEGLGFFYIPHDGSVKQRLDARAALIQVIEGNLTVHEVVSELERLIPGDLS